ncbi:MAG: hypothetical protein LUG57_06040 [Oscillospiraceae bacterium]|nr:hypothetical protein [Oscillospiraceae bacterium]
MKRLFALTLALCLCLGCLAVSAWADGEGAISMTASTAVASPGDTVTVTVSLDSNPGTCLLELIISYDETRLEKVGDYAETSGSMDGSGVWTFGSNAIWDNDSNSSYTGAIATLTYRVLDDAPEGQADISISVRSAMDWDTLEDVSFTVTPASVTVESGCDHVYDDGVEDASGATTYTCTICGYSYTDTPAAEAQSAAAETAENLDADETEPEADEYTESETSSDFEDSAQEETRAEETAETINTTESSAGERETKSFQPTIVFWIALAAAILGIVVIIVVAATGRRDRW